MSESKEYLVLVYIRNIYLYIFIYCMIMAKEYSYHKQPILKMLEHIFLRCVPSRQGIEEVAEIHELEIISSGLVFMGQPDSTPRIVCKCAYLEIWLDLDRFGFYMFLHIFWG